MVFDGTEYVNGGTMYSIRAKLDMDISKVWPLNEEPNSITHSPADGSLVNTFYAWNPPMYLNTHPDAGAQWVSRRPIFTESMIPGPGFGNGQETEYTLTGSWTNRPVTITLNYMFEALDPAKAMQGTKGVDWVQMVVNGKNTIFEKSTKYTQTVVTNQNTTFGLKGIEGMVEVGEDALAYNPGTGELYSGRGMTNQFLLYTRNRHNFHFDTVGGSTIEPWAGVMYEMPLTAPEDPTRTGYIFAGWYLDGEYEQPFTFTDETTMPNRDMKLFAKWESDELKATFYKKSGGEVLGRQGVAIGGKVIEPKPTDDYYLEVGRPYEGYGEFVGWYHTLASGLVVPFNFNTPIYKDAHIYALYKTEGFTLTYDANGATGGTLPVDDNLYKLDVLAGVARADLVKDDLVLVGWESNLKPGVIYFPGTTISMYGNITLKAIYADPATLVPLVFNANDGTENPATDERMVAPGSSVVLPANTFFAREGYELVGWDLSPAATTPTYDCEDLYTVPQKGATLYAVWKEIKYYTVTYVVKTEDSHKGTIDLTDGKKDFFGNIKEGTASRLAVPAAERPTVNANTGYVFTGWDRSLPSLIQDDITLYATFRDLTPIDPAKLSVKDTSKTYGELDPAFLLEGLPTGISQEYFDITWTRAPGQDVDGYEIRVTSIALKPAYNSIAYMVGTGSVGTGTLTINPRAVTLTPIADGKSFGDIDPAEMKALEDLAPLANPDTTFTRDKLVYSVRRDKSGTEEGENVGNYRMYIATAAGAEDLAAIQAANPNYIVKVNELADGFSIIPNGTVLIKMPTLGKTYGYSDPDLQSMLSIIGVREADKAALNAKVTRTTDGDDNLENDNVDTYQYNITYNTRFTLEHQEYQLVSVEKGVFNINPRVIYLVANSYSKYSDQADPSFTAYINKKASDPGRLYGSDKLVYSVFRANPSDNSVGNKPISIRLGTGDAAAMNLNYEIHLRGGNLAISDRTTTTPDPTPPPVPVVVVPVDPPPPVIVIPDEELETEVVPEATLPDEEPVNAPPVELDGEELPMANLGAWALLNLIIAVLTLVFAVLLLVTAFKRNKKKGETEEEQQARMAAQAANGEEPDETERNKKSGMLWRVLAILAGIAAPIVFLLTENIRLPMQFTDRWTLLMVIILVVQVIGMLLMKRARNQEKDEDEEQPTEA